MSYPDEHILDSTLRQLHNVRQSLLRLHKALLESERETYERAHGRINGSYEVLQLVLHDPWFAWLHRISGLVLQLDEMVEGDEPPGENIVTAVLDQMRILLIPSETGDDFQTRYFASLQKFPDVVLAHSEVIRLLRPVNHVIKLVI